jgi:hypothetical protein
MCNLARRGTPGGGELCDRDKGQSFVDAIGIENAAAAEEPFARRGWWWSRMRVAGGPKHRKEAGKFQKEPWLEAENLQVALAGEDYAEEAAVGQSEYSRIVNPWRSMRGSGSSTGISEWAG